MAAAEHIRRSSGQAQVPAVHATSGIVTSFGGQHQWLHTESTLQSGGRFDSSYRKQVRRVWAGQRPAIWMKDSVPGRLTNRKDVCAIAVTYHPNTEFPARLSRILPQVGALVIVDNGLGNTEMLRELAANPLITLVLNLDNLGIARALNIGIQRAVTLGFTWVLLLDQDSCVDDDMVQDLFAVRAAYPNKDQLAVIGSGFRDVNKGSREATHEARADPWEEAEMVITSGSLIPLAAHAIIGPFREEFFIDSVDTDYCFRARAKGFRVIKTRKTIMSHAVGASTQHSLLWMNKWTTNHSPDRRYYIARNDTVMLREYGNYVLGLWALKSFARCFRLCKRIVLYEQMKTSKIIAVVQGWWDGMRGHMGPRAHRQSKNGHRLNQT
jgi:rhamnosyltransferase